MQMSMPSWAATWLSCSASADSGEGMDGPERGLPHHYFTPEELRELFWGYYCLSAVKQ